MEFWKLHGVGNDFIAIDGRFDNIDANCYSEIAKKVCHRHFGIGADGLLVVKNSDCCDIEMVYYNSDGSRANMCGNGLRCFCKYVYDRKIINSNEFTVYTLDGEKKIILDTKEDNILSIKVNMGKPNFNPKFIPVDIDKDKCIKESIKIEDKVFEINSVLMGVPHTIVFVEELSKEETKNILLKIKPLYEKYHNCIIKEELIDLIINYSDKYNAEEGCYYVNSKESLIFKKSELLYNYHRAKEFARKKKSVIIVEGFMDVIALHMVGVYNVVASMGTAITKEHAKLLKKLSTNIIMCFDGDNAGNKATLACAKELNEIGIEPKVIRLPDNLDPDEFIKNYGVDKFNFDDKNEIAARVERDFGAFLGVKDEVDLVVHNDEGVNISNLAKEIMNFVEKEK